MIEIMISGIIGLVIGLMIDRNARRERDERIAELENRLATDRNVMDAKNETINRMRKKLDKRNGKKEEENG